MLAAAKGCEAAIHTAALLGGASQDIADFHAVNVVGTTNVLDAGRTLGMRRVVALSTATFFDLSQPGSRRGSTGTPHIRPKTPTPSPSWRRFVRSRSGRRTAMTC